MAELIWPLIAAFVLAYVTSLPPRGVAAPVPEPVPVPVAQPEVPNED